MRRFGHGCLIVQNAVKGDIPEHFEIFRAPLSQLHNHNTWKGYLPRLPMPQAEWGRQNTKFGAFNDWVTLPIALKREVPDMIFKRHLKKCLEIFFSFMYTFLMESLLLQV